MKSFSKFFPIVMIILMGYFYAEGQRDDNRTLMTIAGDKVTVSEFMRVYNKNNLNKEQNNPEAIREYLDLYINFRLKVKEAMGLGLDTVQSFIKELEGYRKQLAQPYFIDESVSEHLLQEAYQRKLYDIRANHILFRVDKNAPPGDTLKAYKKAIDARNRIINGKSFGKVAAELSDDPSARDSEANQYRPARKGNQGDLGYFTVFDMVYPFETGAYNTQLNSVSIPVRSDYGYHLIYITDKQPALGQVQVAHIYVAIPPNATPQDSVQKREKIEEAYAKVLERMPFDKIVSQFSEDKGSVANGGKLPWFGSNRMVPDFIIATRNLKDTGDISKPFLTPFGWHIIKLLDHKPVGTFEEEKFNLKNRLDKDQRAAMAEDAVLRRIKDEYNFKEYPKAREAVHTVLDTTLLKGEWNVAKAAGLGKTVFIIGDKKYNQQDLAKLIAEKQNKRIKDINSFFEDTYTSWVKESVIAYEDARLEVKYPDFKSLMQEYHDGILLFDLTDKKVWSKAVKDTTGLREFYSQNQSKYMWDKRLKADVVTLLKPENVNSDELRTMFEASTPSSQILEKFNSDTIASISIESGKYPKGDNDVIDKIKWKTGLSPMVDTKEGPAFAYVHEMLKPEPKTLDEARGLVTADYQSFLEEQWIKELRAKYPVVVDEAVLSTLK